VIFADSSAGDTGNAVGGGRDSITVGANAVVYADAYSNAGAASRAGRDSIEAASVTGARTIFADPLGATGAFGAARDEITLSGGDVGVIYADAANGSSGPAVGAARDVINTGTSADVIFGDSYSASGVASGGAPDLIRTRGGADTVYADHSDPTDIGGGRDEVFAGAGLDTIYGGPLFDLCDGGPDSPDTVFQCEKILNVP
jgi:hypothetical protein